ncbi:MAG: tRNA epoxyqueuosine(34) reductase QueG [Pseudomonadota bacterium]
MQPPASDQAPASDQERPAPTDPESAASPAEQLAVIEGWALAAGFDAIGVTDIDLERYRAHLDAYLAAGHHGEMDYLARNRDKRLAPDQLVPGTTRVISARMPYLPPDTEPLRILHDPTRAYVSRYTLGRDYHKVLRRRLAKICERINATFGGGLRAFTDSAPVLEKGLGAKAGLGWIGKHTLLLDRDKGSWFFLGEIFVNLPLPVTATEAENQCGACRACMTVCPTDAIIGPQQLDARRCISYLTIEHRGAIPEALRPAIGNRIFGCDDCQLYCPWNRYAQASAEPDFAPRAGLADASLLALFRWSEAEFLQATEGSAIRRIDYTRWRRNLAVALGNAPPDAAVVEALQQARSDAPPLVREHIDWALTRQRAGLASAAADR